MKKLIYLIGVGLAIIFAGGCISHDQETIVKTLPAQEFQEALIEEKGVLIDVRSREEYAEGHIAGAINIDVNADDYPVRIDSLDKEAAYFIYCKSGKRSIKAMDIMKNSGFKRLYSLEGGILEWREKNFPVIKKEELREGYKSN